MAQSQKIAIQTNIPLVGVIQYADVVQSDHAKSMGWEPDLALKGEWEGFGTGTVYVKAWMADGMVASGLLTPNGTDNRGHPGYKVNGRPRVQVLRLEEGTKKVTTVSALDAQAAPTRTAPAVATPPKEAARQVYAPPRDEVPLPDAPEDAVPARQAQPGNPNDPWSELASTYNRALAIAIGAWPQGTDPAVIQAATATLVIAADKRGIR